MPEDFPQIDKDLIHSYGGTLSSTASHRSFIDIQPNISVRPEFNRRDYYRFRTGEAIPDDSKDVVKMCMEAYNKVGIIRNIIDLMGDFASQGIILNHPDKKIQKFYRNWWKLVRGTERSERFLNTLYRCGNVIIRRQYAKPSKKTRKDMAKGMDIAEIEKEKVYKNTIPYRYHIMNPCQVEVKGGTAGVFFGKPVYQMVIPEASISSLKKENAEAFNSLPTSIKNAVNSGKDRLDLSPEDTLVFHYKKDDWKLWANPLISAILDDIVMMEKFKLADMAALDGAISNIRLWRLGSLEHKIMPQKAAVDRLRDILASNAGGGVLDLVWGPEIDFKESSTQIYHFLGDEKYIPVLNAIYAGLGIPPTLTGLAGQSGGYTNNFVSLKTLIDRLEYGRSLLAEFWEKEIKIVQKAMGFKAPARIHFDFMLLSDEAAEKNLLMSLADKGYISVETLRDRIGEDNELENTRVQSEYEDENNEKRPPRSDPFHNGNHKKELEKIALQKGLLGIQDVTDIDPKHAPPVNDFKPAAPNGRPKFSQDTKPRKTKTVKPKTTPTNAIIWASKAYRLVSEKIQPKILEHLAKSNLRDLTKEDKKAMNEIELSIFSNIPLFAKIDDVVIAQSNKPMNSLFRENYERLMSEYLHQYGTNPQLDDIRQIVCLSYLETYL